MPLIAELRVTLRDLMPEDDACLASPGPNDLNYVISSRLSDALQEQAERRGVPFHHLVKQLRDEVNGIL